MYHENTSVLLISPCALETFPLAAIITGFLGAGIISLIILAGFHGKSSDAVWRVMFGVGIAVSRTGQCSIVEAYQNATRRDEMAKRQTSIDGY